MPEGVKGFQKGRLKTGGRTKQSASNNAAKRSSKFVEQLRGSGFDYVKELALALKELKNLPEKISGDPKKLTEEMKKMEEIRHYYSELKSLLPYMAPRLREKEVEVAVDPETPAAPTVAARPISDEELLKALGDGTKTDDNPRPSNPTMLEAGNSQLQVPASTEENLHNLAGEQEEDS